MDREAFTSDLGDDRRGPGFLFWRFRKSQHVVLAVLHSTTHASRPKAIASLRTAGKSLLLNGPRFPTLARSSLGIYRFRLGPKRTQFPAVDTSTTQIAKKKTPFSFHLSNRATDLRASSGGPENQSHPVVNSAPNGAEHQWREGNSATDRNTNRAGRNR
jgi:hypothetical protein